MIRKTIFLIVSLIFLSAFEPQQEIQTGKGSFLFAGYQPLEDKPVQVYYYRPEGDVSSMPVLFVMHGTNRNADDYRDNWVDLADEYNILVIVPEFSDEHFPGSRGYNLGNMFDRQGDPVEEAYWSYSLIEPIFDHVVALTGSEQKSYDIFGHSAGAQFTHRFLLFKNDTKMNRVVSSNAGWYTMTDFNTDFPYGLNHTALNRNLLTERFKQRHVIQLGELDTDPNHRYLRTSREAMEQGGHRFERGHHFYKKAKELSEKKGTEFNWQIRTVSGVGHNNAGMAVDAAKYLYSRKTEDTER